jgi:hypothetical protein
VRGFGTIKKNYNGDNQYYVKARARKEVGFLFVQLLKKAQV